MPSVGQNASRPRGQGQKKQLLQKKRRLPTVVPDESPGAELIVDCKYGNELPKPPVPKMLRALPRLERLCQYRPTSLELDHRPFLLSEKHLLACVELVDPDAYGETRPAGSMLPPPPPLDAQLLRDDDFSQEVREAEVKRRRLTEVTEASHRQAFGLQLPQLITNDVFTERQRFTTGLEAPEKKMRRNPPGYASLEDLIAKIETTFEVASQPPVHPTNPTLKAKRILSIVPDAVLWANNYKQIIFDEMPPQREPTRNDLLFRTTPDPRTTCFGYFAPESDESGENAGDAGQFKLKQNYFWDNRGEFTNASDLGEGESVLLSFPSDDDPKEQAEVRYVTMPHIIKLKKQKAHRLDIELDTKQLNVAHRQPSAQEITEEHERMNVVLSDEQAVAKSEASLDYIEGEWQIRGDPRSQSGRSEQPSEHAESPRLPLAMSPAGLQSPVSAGRSPGFPRSPGPAGRSPGPVRYVG
mmetsp:Transcript_58080/g.94011  ORF Transcript_58080/g.94011 Transcript_58080/m.94011 type:complete len:469 (+) Transcript_58080:91-1497(+)|eukprot:CAMPEP_0115096626 /NCGR_PEP_ID=MMETSP0227-20121206/29849_1 /TAXON_ID=89957 /ORGANISM="Polarella glacialis, Strain CCMP 1383" /LENGTH=468 /DNA_ID=CAMNT_0002490423 /DNA_START=91 /DNA_END=1497 /DNA_ORIENTATION=+